MPGEWRAEMCLGCRTCCNVTSSSGWFSVVMAFTFIKIESVISGKAERFLLTSLTQNNLISNVARKQWLCGFFRTSSGFFHWVGLWKLLSKHDPVIWNVDRRRMPSLQCGWPMHSPNGVLISGLAAHFLHLAINDGKRMDLEMTCILRGPYLCDFDHFTFSGSHQRVYFVYLHNGPGICLSVWLSIHLSFIISSTNISWVWAINRHCRWECEDK